MGWGRGGPTFACCPVWAQVAPVRHVLYFSLCLDSGSIPKATAPTFSGCPLGCGSPRMDEGCLLVQKPPRGPSRAPTLISCGPLVPVSSRGLRQAVLRFGPPPHGGLVPLGHWSALWQRIPARWPLPNDIYRCAFFFLYYRNIELYLFHVFIIIRVYTIIYYFFFFHYLLLFKSIGCVLGFFSYPLNKHF